MLENEKSLEDIDAEFDRLIEEALKKEDDKEENDSVDNQEDDSKDTNDEQDDKFADNENESEGEKDEEESKEDSVKEEKKPVVKEDKKDYAFSKLRKQLSESERRKQELEARIDELESLASELGLGTADKLISTLKDKQIELDASAQGIDPQVLKRLREAETQIKVLTKQKEQEAQRAAVLRLNTELTSFAKEHKLSEEQMDTIVNAMGDDGYSLEDLTKIKSLKKLLIGYSADYLQEDSTQAKLEEEEKKVFDNKKYEKTAPAKSKKSVDDLLKEELGGMGGLYPNKW